MSKELFELIKSLSKQEKRHFKLFAQRHRIGSEIISIKLFDAIASQKEYNDQTLKIKFLKTGFSVHFAVTKHNLFYLILKSLNAYNTDVNRELDELIHSINILYNKQLFHTCKKLLLKAKKIAVNLEKWERLIELEQIEGKIHLSDFDMKQFKSFAESSYLNKKSAIQKIENVSDYRLLYYRIMTRMGKSDMTRKKSELTGYKKITRNKLFKNEHYAKSLNARYYFYASRYFYYRAIGNLQENYSYQLKMVEFLEKYPQFIRQDNQKYIAALNNLIIAQTQLKLFDQALITVYKLREMISKYKLPSTFDLKMRIFTRSYHSELQIYILVGEFSKGIKIAHHIEEGLKKFFRKIGIEYQIMFYYQLFYVYFGNEQYSKALHFLNKVLSHKQIINLPEVNSIARITNLILHYEIGNFDLLEHVVRAVKRNLELSNRLFKVESALLKFIRKEAVQEETQQSFLELKKEIENIIQDPFEKKILEYFDFISWIESKIENRQFAEVVRSRLRTDSAF